MAGTRLKLKGFKELAEIFAPGKFEKRLHAEVRKATAKNALLAEAAIKRGINKGITPPNAAATAALKGSSRPLVDSGELVKSVTGRQEDWDRLVVGVLKSRQVVDKKTGRKRDLLSIAPILHNGATVQVTQKMRNFFFMMAEKYEKGEIKEPWFPLSARTKVIVIPPRPFLKFALAKTMIRKYTDNWDKAVNAALAGALAK